MKTQQFHELVLQSLEHEMGGVEVYTTALQCVINDDLKEEWEKYLGETRMHVTRLRAICESLDIDPDKETPGRLVVRHTGHGIVKAMKMALEAGDRDAAQLVACECVVLAETKDHMDWELLSKCGEHVLDAKGKVLRDACEEIEEQEDEHLYHTKGWCRELWVQSLGLKAVLPPMEEERHVKTAIGAARAEQAADKKARGAKR